MIWKTLARLFGKPPSDSAPVAARPARDTSPGGPRVEVSLRESQRHFGQMVAGVRDYAVFLLDRSGRILTWNTGAEHIKGYRAEEIIGQHFSRFYPNESISSGWPAHELEVAAQTGRFEDEGWRVRKDGSRFWANVVITALRDPSGETWGFLKITRDLTERKRAEEKLRLSEERFRLIVEGVRDYAIFMLDPSGYVATWNTGAERLKGYKASEIVGQHFSKFYPADLAQSGWPEEELRRASDTGRFEDEGWRVRKDGSLFWANVVITALRDDSGSLLGFAKVTRDLTERKQAEENARRLIEEESALKTAQNAARENQRQHEQLHVTLASIGDAVIVTDERGRVTFLNRVATELTGWQTSEAAGLPLDQVFPIIDERTRLGLENPVERVYRERRIVALANHTSLLTRDGREIPIEDTAAPILQTEGGEMIGAVFVFRDVTEARRSRDMRQFLAAIVESSDDAIIGKSLDGIITSWNRGAERLYGYTAAEIVGKPLAALVPPDHPDEIEAILQRVRRGEHIEHFETQRVRKDGSLVEVSLTISPIRDEDGTIIGASKIARDITSRKEEERRRSEFLAVLAHELRNPLAPLRNGLEILRSADSRPDVVEHTRVMMERQLRHLVRLVDDLLDVSRISRGKLQLRKERLTLASIVEHALEVCGPSVGEHGHHLHASVPDEPLYLDADRTRMAQILCNLLSNAVKYSEPGSPIHLSVEREGRQAVFRVRDAGVGIPSEMQPHIFEMFTQVDRTLERSQGGLGVGLSIVKRLVEMHGGDVAVKSAGYGTGSEFVIRLPLVEARAKDPVGIAARRPLSPPPRRVLVVDDHADAAESLSMMLRLMGSEVRTSSDGEAGVQVAAAFRPEVILMDIGMPRLNGYEACRRMRQEPWGHDITIIALTGWGQEEDKRQSREAGFDGHLVKPVEPADLDVLLSSLPHARKDRNPEPQNASGG
jgi:PAS domain S-box-containing protein